MFPDNDTETVTILKSAYEELLRDSYFLNQLEAHGVDNWDGYEFAKEDMIEYDGDNK